MVFSSSVEVSRTLGRVRGEAQKPRARHRDRLDGRNDGLATLTKRRIRGYQCGRQSRGSGQGRVGKVGGGHGGVVGRHGGVVGRHGGVGGRARNTQS